MRKFILAIALCGALSGCAGVEGKGERIDALTAQKVEQYKADNKVDAVPLAVQARLREEAEKQVQAEIKKDREAAAQKAAEVATNVAAGNYVAGGLGLLGLLGLALGIYKKGAVAKAAANKPPGAV